MAFAGFSGIVSVFGRSHLHARIQVWRVRSMILSSLLSICFAVLPLLMNELGFSEPVLVRTCSGALAVTMAAWIGITWRGQIPLMRDGILNRWILGAVVSVVAGLVVLGLLANVLALAPTMSGGIYCIGLFWLLFVSAVHFFMLVVAAQPVDG